MPLTLHFVLGDVVQTAYHKVTLSQLRGINLDEGVAILRVIHQKMADP